MSGVMAEVPALGAATEPPPVLSEDRMEALGLPLEKDLDRDQLVEKLALLAEALKPEEWVGLRVGVYFPLMRKVYWAQVLHLFSDGQHQLIFDGTSPAHTGTVQALALVQAARLVQGVLLPRAGVAGTPWPQPGRCPHVAWTEW